MTLTDGNAAHRELLEQQAFLRRLARHLVADAHVAEDLVQETSVLALERAPRQLVSLRSWLARVLRNQAAKTARGERRRAERERDAARPDEPQTPEEVTQHLAVQRRVLVAVEALSEPYKSTIYLRYYLDLTPSAIAERTGVPVATVKTRLARGLDRLRAELDAGYGGDRNAWALCLAGTLRVETAVGASVAAIGTSVATGGAVMAATSVGTKWGAAALAVALAGWIGTSVVQQAVEPEKAEPRALVADHEAAASANAARESVDGGELRLPAPEPDAIARVAAHDAAPTEAAPVVELTREQLWEQEYRDLSASELEAAAQVLREALHESTYDELVRRLDMGLGEYIGNEDFISADKVDAEKITLVRQGRNNSGNYRVILPENEFPELYELHAKLRWVRREAREREYRELVEARNAAKSSIPR